MSEDPQTIRRGTWLTNFVIKDKSFYEEAIKIYEDKDLFISEKMIDGELYNEMSLHYKGKNSLEAFWAIFNDLKYNCCKTCPPKYIFKVLDIANAAKIDIPLSVRNWWVKETIKENPK